MKPLAIGSATLTKTIGIVRVACKSAPVAGVVLASMTSSLSPTSAAAARMSSCASPAQRYSIVTLLPAFQPSSAIRRSNAAIHFLASKSVSAYAISTPMRRIRPCCAWAESGHAAAAPLRRAMN